MRQYLKYFCQHKIALYSESQTTFSSHKLLKKNLGNLFVPLILSRMSPNQVVYE